MLTSFSLKLNVVLRSQINLRIKSVTVLKLNHNIKASLRGAFLERLLLTSQTEGDQQNLKCPELFT